MSYDTYRGDIEDKGAILAYLMQLFSSARLQRSGFEPQWEEAAAMYWPEYRGSFSFGNIRAQGSKYSQYQVDSTGSLMAFRFMSIFDVLVTPFNSVWSELRAADPYLRKQKGVRSYYQDISAILWTERYRAVANFHAQNQQNAHALGVFGNMGMFVERLDPRPGVYPAGLSYTSTSPGEIYPLQNHQGRVDAYIRSIQWTAREAFSKWPKIGTEPEYQTLKAALEKGDVYTKFNFLEFVIPRTDYDPYKIFSAQSKPWSSTYVSITGNCIIEQDGYHSFPMPMGRYLQAPGEWLGRGPGQISLATGKTLNSAMEAYLRTSVEAGDPSYLLPEDTLFDFQRGAGKDIFGGVNDDGRPMVQVKPAGEIQITEDTLVRLTKVQSGIWLNDLFPLLFEQKGPQRGAREVVEMAIQQGIFLSPLARQYTEYCGPLNDREVDLLARMGKFDRIPVPGVIKEAGNEYESLFTSPLAQALDMPAVGGFMRTVDLAAQISQAQGGDRSVFYHFAFNRALPAIAANQRAPEDWMSTDKEVADQQRAAAEEKKRDDYIKSLPGLAAQAKAEAITAKAATGGNIGGTLSGTPEGGMPMMPGQ